MSRHVPGRRRMAGLSLVELMVAILLGTFLLLGLVQVFSASRVAYQLSQGVARAQENGRFAMDFLLRDMRMVGHGGCVNDQALTMVGGGGINSSLDTSQFGLRFDVAIQGYEANGTGSGAAVALPANPVEGAAAAWTPALPAELTGLANSPIAGSDVIVLRFLSPVGTTLSGLGMGAPATITPVADGATVATEFGTTRSLFALADCQQATVFQASSINAATGQLGVSASGLNATALAGLERYSVGQTVLYRAESVAYYVALNASGNPALYRVRWEAAPGAGALTRTPEELVEGIETLQFLYGKDAAALTDPAPRGYIDSYANAGTIGDPISDNAKVLDWRRVGTVQLGVIARSIQRAGNYEQPNENVLGVVFTPPADRHYRSVYENTVALRNRMFGN